MLRSTLQGHAGGPEGEEYEVSDGDCSGGQRSRHGCLRLIRRDECVNNCEDSQGSGENTKLWVDHSGLEHHALPPV